MQLKLKHLPTKTEALGTTPGQQQKLETTWFQME
jgi:hypothetical protein